LIYFLKNFLFPYPTRPIRPEPRRSMVEGSGTAEGSGIVVNSNAGVVSNIEVVSNPEVVSNTAIVGSKENEVAVADGSKLEAALPPLLPLLLHPLPPPPPSRHPINK